MTTPREDLQYDAWGMIVQTSRVRSGHIANGMVQLLRLLPSPPKMRTPEEAAEGRVQDYNRDVLNALRNRFETRWQLSDKARDLCINASPLGDPSDAREHEKRSLVAGALNADRLVMVTGGSDPTTPGLSMAGYTSTHTLKGMHAATFLGLLCKSLEGREALRLLHSLLASADDPHTTLVRRLGIGMDFDGAGASSTADGTDLFPTPAGPNWERIAAHTGAMAKCLLEWSSRGMSKANTLMAMTDLAALILFLGIARWRPVDSGMAAPMLLVVSPFELEASHYSVIARAQQNLKAVLAALDQAGREKGLVIEKTSPRTNKTTVYWPSVHAQNVGAASGWLYPLDSRGGAKRYLRPGPRQLTTLVHALVAPGEDISWQEFTSRTLALGLVLGGTREASVAAQLRLNGGAFSIREAGRINRHHVVALGLARQEADNVVRVDGGLK